jgi:hypothetical protein
MDTTKLNDQSAGQWAIVELMGHKVVAGYVTKDEMFGQPLMRVDVPETSVYPAFIQQYGVSALYCLTYVSEEVARRAAEANKVNPVSVYVPDVSDVPGLRAQNEKLRQQVNALRSGLPAPKRDGDDEDDDHEDAEYDDEDRT